MGCDTKPWSAPHYSSAQELVLHRVNLFVEEGVETVVVSRLLITLLINFFLSFFLLSNTATSVAHT